MARIKLPSYIKEGNGRMEDAVLVTRGGESYMMIYKKHDSGNSAEQEAVRTAFKTVVMDWRYLDGIIREAWAMPTKGTNVSGYNNFMGANVIRRRDGQPIVLCPGMGEEILMNFEALPGSAAGDISCTFLAPEQGCHVTFFTRRITEPGVKALITRHDAGANPVSPHVITGLETGAQYHVFAVVTDKAYTEAATVSASVVSVAQAR